MIVSNYICEMFRAYSYYTPGYAWFEYLDDEFLDDHLFEGRVLSYLLTLTMRERGLWLIGRLWNCTSIMPRLLCDDLDVPQGSSYARGVRKLRTETPDEP